jgi:tetrahydromethanopterin S-methyltransferase subunit E
VVTVLVGLLLSLLSFVYDGRETTAIQLLNPITLAGIAFLVGAMAAAAITYSTGEYHAGAEDSAGSSRTGTRTASSGGRCTRTSSSATPTGSRRTGGRTSARACSSP